MSRRGIRVPFAVVRHRGRSRGLTLVECLIAASVLAIAASAALVPFAAGLKQTQDSARLEQAAELASSLLDEIAAHPFEDPDNANDRTLGPDAGETSRQLFDNVDDYNGYSDPTTAPTDARGASLTASNLAGLRRTVTVSYVTLSGQAVQPNHVFALVTVRVFDGSALILTVNRLLGREY